MTNKNVGFSTFFKCVKITSEGGDENRIRINIEGDDKIEYKTKLFSISKGI